MIAIFRDLHDILISTNLPTPFCWARIYRIQSGESLTVLSAGQGWVSSRKDGAWRKLRIDPMSAFGIGAKSIRLATRQVCPRNDMEPDFVLAVAANGRFDAPQSVPRISVEWQQSGTLTFSRCPQSAHTFTGNILEPPPCRFEQPSDPQCFVSLGPTIEYDPISVQVDF